MTGGSCLHQRGGRRRPRRSTVGALLEACDQIPRALSALRQRQWVSQRLWSRMNRGGGGIKGLLIVSGATRQPEPALLLHPPHPMKMLVAHVFNSKWYICAMSLSLGCVMMVMRLTGFRDTPPRRSVFCERHGTRNLTSVSGHCRIQCSAQLTYRAAFLGTSRVPVHTKDFIRIAVVWFAAARWKAARIISRLPRVCASSDGRRVCTPPL